MDKPFILSCVIEALRSEAERIEMSAAGTQREATEAPSPMESYSDKTKFEMQTMTGALRQASERIRRAITTLEGFTCPPAGGRIAAGTLAVTEETGQNHKWYFMLPEGAGITIPQGKETIIVITPQTPLGAALMGKRAGDAVEFKGTATRTLTIVRLE